jgi:3-deoxy-D-manno-octulosonic-acid transferase
LKAPGLHLRLYRNLSPLLAGMLPQLAMRHAKLASGVAGRQGLWERLTSSAEKVRGGVWFHVTSVGEYEQARPLVTALERLYPELPVMVTHFSPSGYNFARKRPCARVHEYLPFDEPGQMRRLVQLWQPRMLVFVKFDLWPNQVLAANAAGVPLLLLAGSLAPHSGRLHPLVRPMYRDLFDRFDHLGVCTPDDARRFREDLGVSCPISVTGDTRVEQVIVRFEAAQDGPIAALLKTPGRRNLILGSTWPPDENLWLPVMKPILERFPDLRVVLTPHEPELPRLAELESRLDRDRIVHKRLSALSETSTPLDDPVRVVLVDSIGHLAEIYRSGDLAYVGGSFTTGVHNTMEPAVASMPVLFGPRIQNAEEAGFLVKRGAGWVLEKPVDALARASELLGDSEALERAGQAARQVVLDQRGATERSLAVMTPYFS